MEIYLCTSQLYEETITTDYATAKLLYELHKDTATMINYSVHKENETIVHYKITWRKNR